MSEEHAHELRLTQNEGPRLPTFFDDLKKRIDALLPTALDAGTSYIKGKGEQEIAKAAAIRADVVKTLADIQIEIQRLIIERDDLRRKNEHEFQLRMYELKAQHLERIARLVLDLHQAGARVSLTVVTKKLMASLDGPS